MRREISQFSLGSQPTSTDTGLRGVQSSIAEMLSLNDYATRTDTAFRQGSGAIYHL